MRKTRATARLEIAAGLILALAAAAGIVAADSPAWADYGRGAAYQVELSANVGGRQGGGVWLWIELNRDGTGDYQGSDCGHGGQGAAHDSGDVTWRIASSQVVIDDVVLNGLGGFAATVTVPAAYGHYTGTVGSYITLPPFIPPTAGNSQLSRPELCALSAGGLSSSMQLLEEVW
jgi:hypothetical protein